MRLMLLGSPGVGKGTQSNLLTRRFNIPQISTGDMLRTAVAHHTPIGLKAKAIMARGELVPDSIIIDMVKARLREPDCANGYLFDGFPRTIPQAEALKEAHIALDHVVEIVLPDADIIRRLTGRRVHLPSGRVYHVEFNPPHTVDKDDLTQEPLIQREDDQEETIRNRLMVYHQQTKPLIAFYSQWYASGESDAPAFHQVSGEGRVDEIFEEVLSFIAPEMTTKDM